MNPEKLRRYALIKLADPRRTMVDSSDELWNFLCREDWLKLFRAAKENQLILPFCKNILSLPKLPVEVKKKANEQLSSGKKAINSFKKTMQIIFRAFERRNIQFVAMKTVRSYAYSSVDIDIILYKESIEKALRILEELGYKIYRGIIAYEPYKVVCRSKIFTVDVDIYPKIAWRRITFLNAASVLNRRKSTSFHKTKLYAPSDEDELLIVCSHAFSHCNVLLGDIFHIMLLLEKRKDSVDWNYVLKTAKMNGIIPTLFWFIYLIFLISKSSIGNSVIPSKVFERFQKFSIMKIFHRFIVADIFKNDEKFPYIFSPILLLLTTAYGIISDIRTLRFLMAFERLVKSISQLGRLIFVILGIYPYR